MPAYKPIEQRLEDLSIPEPNSGCQIWLGFINPKGYPIIEPGDSGLSQLAYKAAYQIECGEVPEGHTLDHLCRTRCCINVGHLEAVLHIVNVRRGSRATRTHCRKGHPLEGQNLIVNSRGARYCRICTNTEARRRWRDKNV